jgi:hypothetical protein
MLKVDKETLESMESQYNGIIESIMGFENADLPPCPHCQSDNTADVQIGVIGRTMTIGAATTKFKLIPYGPKPGRYFCNECNKYFGVADGKSGGFTLRPKDRSFQAFKEFITGISVAVAPEVNKQELSEAKLVDSWRRFWNLPADTRPSDVKE